MERPRITIHILSALDRKISGPFMALPPPRRQPGNTLGFAPHMRPTPGCMAPRPPRNSPGIDAPFWVAASMPLPLAISWQKATPTSTMSL